MSRAVFIEPHVRWNGTQRGEEVVVHFANGLERVFRTEAEALAYIDAGRTPQRSAREEYMRRYPDRLPPPNRENS